jgi:hypothetical protein
MEKPKDPAVETPDGYRSHCWFCHGKWGECKCDWHDYSAYGIIPEDAEGFDWNGEMFISQPNVSCNTIDFVNPSIYYGQAFVSWWENHPKNPTPCDDHCRERMECRHGLWREVK